MLANLLGSINKELVLVFLAARNRGYARQIARFFDTPLSPIQYALDRLEIAGVLISRLVGTTREYEFDPRYAARSELLQLLNRALDLYPSKLRDELREYRARPRRRGKPL
ncbi:MAG TPA: hypothetical protein VIM11_28675 [Tepidisphaeraceae bacterium]|jgi:hypothetical protein